MDLNSGDQCCSDILSLEIQRKAILPQTTSPMTYKERLIHLNILPLMHVPPWAGGRYIFYKLVQKSFKQIRYIQECYSCYGDYQVVWLKHTFVWNGLPSIDISLSSKTINREFLWLQFTLNFYSDSPCNKCPVWTIIIICIIIFLR